ncbi:SIR2 family protein [Psychrobacter sp. AT9]|uniref:SIR2 family protein n=1 Tax=Psychrobacter sp. AT9 TaxID=3242893 RepID=UPI0039A44784
MDIPINRELIKREQINTDDIIAKIATGQSILFTGAGFSSLTENVNSEEPSAAKDLAHEICILGGFPEDDDLRFATDYFIENNSKSKLVQLLKNKYTIRNTNSVHDTICTANWKRFYTTNYDKSIEIASANVGKLVECIDVSFPTSTYYKKDSLCIHLNGSIDSLNEDSIESTFKLSTSSYISPESFIDSDWNYYFRKDLERCSAIIFVGYSMYDIEIQKILYENSLLREKTYFITRENPAPKTLFTLAKFGNIVPIGVDGFAKLIEDNKDILDGYDSDYNLKSLALYELSRDRVEIRDADVEAMIMYGHTNITSIDDAVLGEQRVPYIVVRKRLELVKDFIHSGKNIVLYSDMGNGKSIFIAQIHAYLTALSIECYYVHDVEGDFMSDIDYLSKKGNKIVVTLDGYERYQDLIKHYAYSLPDNISIIATSRTGDHENLRPYLRSIKFDYNELSLDTLYKEEVSELVEIIDNLGMWDDKAGFSTDRKIKFIQNKHNSQLSLTLLHLFNAPQIKERISKEISPLLITNDIKDTIFAIALAEIIDTPCTFSMISEISGNDKIYDSKLKTDKNFNNLFHIDEYGVKTKSSLFCLSIIRNYFSPTYVTSTLQKIAKRFNHYNSKDYEQSKVFYSTLRFSFVERLLSDTNKKASLKTYYENLKVSVSWLKSDPHFWLQYGMAQITFKEYGKAQQFLNQSYALALKKDSNYYTNYIDKQQSRLFILVAMEENESHKIYDNFSKAHLILDKLENDVYKFRQVSMYRDFYVACFSKLSKGNQVAFQRACQKMIRSIILSVDKHEIDLSQQIPIRKSKENLEFILESISNLTSA